MNRDVMQSQLAALQATLTQLAAHDLPPAARQALQQAVQQASQLDDAFDQEYTQAAAELAEASQAKNKFVSLVTHELRLPLTSIKGYTDLLRQGIVGPLTDQQKSFLNVIRNNVERMSALIANLSEISYIETGRLNLAPRFTSLQGPVEDTLLPWQAKFTEKGQILLTELSNDLPQVYAEPARIVQVLGNLLQNAHLYTPGGGTITIRAERHNDQVRVSVRDTGVGIGTEDQARVFNQFFRSEHEAVREHPGWGLALHVSKQIVEHMGGQMGFESALNAGSTFWFTLPTS